MTELFSVSYSTPGQAGIFEWFGRNRGQGIFSNPVLAGQQLTLTATPVFSGGSAATAITDRTLNRFFQPDAANPASYQIDFPSDTEVSVTSYSLESAPSSTYNGLPRNWLVEGRTTTGTWINLSSVINNTSFTGNAQVRNFPVPVNTRIVSIRISKTGLDSLGNGWFILSEWEIYGSVFSKSNGNTGSTIIINNAERAKSTVRNSSITLDENSGSNLITIYEPGKTPGTLLSGRYVGALVNLQMVVELFSAPIDTTTNPDGSLVNTWSGKSIEFLFRHSSSAPETRLRLIDLPSSSAEYSLDLWSVIFGRRGFYFSPDSRLSVRVFDSGNGLLTGNETARIFGSFTEGEEFV